MAESTFGYLPDIDVGWDARIIKGHKTEVTRARSAKEQRRGVWPAAGFLRMTTTGAGADLPTRLALAKFFDNRRGQLQAFNFFRPDPSRFENYAATSLAYSTTRFLAPFKEGTYDEVRKANAVQTFTTVALPLRTGGRFAHVFFDPSVISSHIDAGSAAALRTLASLTISAWVYLPAAGTNRGICGNDTVNASGFTFYMSPSRLLNYEVYFPTTFSVVSSTAAIPLNTWTHVAITKSGTTVKFFINGALNTTQTLANTGTDATHNYLIGNRANGGTPNLVFDGLISEFRHYDTDLSAAGILGIYNGEHAIAVSTALRGHWKLDDGYGTTAAAKDSSGYGNNGTLSGDGVMWHGGEDLLVLGSAAASGSSMQIWASARQRLTGVFDSDELPEGFLANVAAVKAQAALAVREVR